MIRIFQSLKGFSTNPNVIFLSIINEYVLQCMQISQCYLQQMNTKEMAAMSRK